MLMRVLTMKVRQEPFEGWKRYTAEVGLPGMLSQPGCREIWRIRRGDEANEVRSGYVVGQHRGFGMYKSAFDLSDMSDVMDDRTAGSMVPRCVVDLKPGVCDAPLHGFGA